MSDAGRCHLTQERRYHHSDGTGPGLAEGAPGVPSVDFSFLYELEGGDTWEEGGHLQGMEKVGNCLHTSFFYFCFPGKYSPRRYTESGKYHPHCVYLVC